MFSRLRHFSHKYSFFLFGPRGTGKSTLIKKRFHKDRCLCLDLLDSSAEDQFLRNLSNLYGL
jgi:predicted AAA+ superfamily ATPase